MGEKGSLKNRLKDFFKIQKKLLEKKKLEKEEKKKIKKQSYRKPKIFIIKLFSYLGLCISYFFFYQKRKILTNKNSPKKLVLHSEKKGIQKETQMKIVTKPLQKERIVINQKNVKLSCDVQVKVSEQDIIKKEEFNKSVKATMKQKIISNQKNISKSKIEILKKEKKVSKIKPLKKIPSQAIIIGALSSHLVSKVSKEIIESLKNNKNEKEKLSLDDLEKQNLKSKKEQIIQKETINNSIHPINQKKVEQKKEENSKQEMKQDLEPFYIRIEEIKIAHDIIQEDLLKQEFEIEKLKEKLKSLSEQEGKKIKLSVIKNTTSKLLNFFNPFHYFFRNTFISKLVHSILINHKIKKMHRILEKEKKVKYYNIQKILKEIKDKKDIIQKNIYINLNTLEEINTLRNNLLKENHKSLEIINILNDLERLENQIIEKNKKLNQEVEKTKELEEKGKIKLKKIV